MMFLFVLFLTLIVSSRQNSKEDGIHSEWLEYKIKFNKTYKNVQDEEFRFKIFLDNKLKIKKHNENFKSGQVQFKMGLTKFTDMLLSEALPMFNSQKTMGMAYTVETKVNRMVFDLGSDDDIPDSVDWRQKGAVTPVLEQGSCYACYAIAAIGAIEGQYFKKFGTLKRFSPQQILDCSRKFGNFGCLGGEISSTFDYLAESGITSEEDYPFQAKSNKCSYDDKRKLPINITGYAEVIKETNLKSAVAKIGPIAAGVTVTELFVNYASGILTDPGCNERWMNVNHAVLVVGYGTENGQDYWLLKSSTGTHWGEEGYIKLRRNQNMCHISSQAYYPIIE